MNTLASVFFALCAAGACMAPSSAATPHSTLKHFRLTFVLGYSHAELSSRSFVLDVPVKADRPGMGSISIASGLTGQVDGSVQEELQCSEVHESAAGIAANVTFTMHSVEAPLAGAAEPLHHELNFQKQIDIVLGKPTTITEEMHAVTLGKEPRPPALPPVPQISVTALEI